MARATSMSKQSKSLRSRLTTLVVVAIFGAVAVATASSVWRETVQYGASKRAELYASANVFASAISEPVHHRDKTSTLNALRAISYIHSIEYVRVDLLDASLFVELGSATAVVDEDKARMFPEYSAFDMLLSNSVSASVPIVRGGEQIGELTMYADTGSLSDRIGLLLYDAFVAAIFAGGIGVLIALKMQRAITDPILSLARVMGHVRESGDFGIRADRTGDDETAQLVDTFNTMLDHIQERDNKLKAHQRNLRKTVDMRTAQLRRAKEAAEAANMAKSDFLATMSHEIRTPMNGMLAMADLLNKARLAPQQKRYAEVIAKSGQSLLAIINDILDFSKIEADRLELEKIAVRPTAIVDDVVSLFWERAATKDIDLAAYVAPETPEEIEGDPVRISQILSNLVNNALKFTDEGHVVVAVKRKKQPGDSAQNNCVIEFSVTDTGVGIAEDKQAAIFEAFSQADQTTTRKFGGTGLGLAISRRLVEAMGGKIGLVSKPGKGARFYFTMPTRVLKPPAPVRRIHDEKRAIIAIEGEATPDILTRYVRETGIIPHLVRNGENFGPHLAYADMIFASVEFFEAYQEAISAGSAQWIPARICVCELGDTKPEYLLESGVVEDLLMAPLSRSDVMEQIDRILDDRMRGLTALQEASIAEPLQVSFSGQNVLAADDSEVNREVVKEALTRLNLNVTLASNGREAVRYAQGQKFDLILMDCSMPEMDGFEASQAIRSLEKHAGETRTPIVALTAHVAGREDQWREAGMDEYLTKPFTLDSLAAVISKFLGEGSGSASSTDAQHEIKKTDAPSQTAAFDPRVLDQLAGMQSGNASLPVRALRLFDEHSREAMRALAESFKSKDNEKIAKAAHALKSMSVNVGACALGAACSNLEAQARAGAAVASMSALCKIVAKEYRAAHQALPAAIKTYEKTAA